MIIVLEQELYEINPKHLTKQAAVKQFKTTEVMSEGLRKQFKEIPIGSSKDNLSFDLKNNKYMRLK